MKAAVYGTVSGVLFGLSSALTKPTLNYLHESVGTMLSHWECYALAVAGVLGFVLQQVSSEQVVSRPPSPPSRSPTPSSGSLIGILLLVESQPPGWHILVAVVGLGLLVGAVIISLARVTPVDGEPPRTRRAGLSPRRSYSARAGRGAF